MGRTIINPEGVESQPFMKTVHSYREEPGKLDCICSPKYIRYDGYVKGIAGLFIEILGMRSAAKGAVAKPPAILFGSIGSAGHASQVVDFLDNFG